MSPTPYSPHPAASQSSLSPTGHPLTPPVPHQSLSAALPLFFFPHPPPNHIPLSCAAAMHKYINPFSMYACVVCVCVCERVSEGVGGVSTYRRLAGNPTGKLLSCVTISLMLSVYTPNQSRHITRDPLPPEPVTLAGEAWGQRLRVNLEVVVPDWLSDLTGCLRRDGTYGQKPEVRGAITYIS